LNCLACIPDESDRFKRSNVCRSQTKKLTFNGFGSPNFVHDARSIAFVADPKRALFNVMILSEKIVMPT
jgi:hypothetical protein